jgi:hypothetical protein
MTGNTTCREARRRFLEILAEAELPPPDEIHWEDKTTVFLWNEIKFLSTSIPTATMSARSTS